MANTMLEELQNSLSAACETLNLDPTLSFQPMFGGIFGYLDGRVFASLSNFGLGLKLSPQDQAALLSEPDAKRLRYGPDAPESKQYIFVSDAMRGNPQALAEWVKQSADYVSSLPVPKPKKAK